MRAPRFCFSMVAVLASCLLVALVVVPVVGAQRVENGSFEQDGKSSLKGWQFTHDMPECGESFEEAPPAGGDWSLKLWLHNVQGGCFSAAYQVVPNVENGDAWKFTVWARTPAASSHTARVHWTRFDTLRDQHYGGFVPEPIGNVDTTSSHSWSLLTVTDTMYVSENDSVGLVLFAGATGGATFETHVTYFDLVAAEKIGEVPSSAESPEHPRGMILFPNIPNPFRTSTTISFSLGHSAEALLVIYDVLGREVASLVDEVLPAGEHAVTWEAEGLPAGVYVVRLESQGEVATRRLTLVR